MDALMEELLEAPDLPVRLQALNQAFAEERVRRKRFYADLTEERRMEFISGRVVMHTPSKWRHSETMGLLHTLLASYVNRRKLGKVGMEKVLIVLTRNDYEPDVVFFGPEKAAHITPDRMKFSAPDLVMEVLSPSTEKRDRGIKKQDYAAHGVGEYWIVDPSKRTIEQHELTDGKYRLLGTWKDDELVGSVVVAGFSIPARAAFDPDANLVALDAFAR